MSHFQCPPARLATYITINIALFVIVLTGLTVGCSSTSISDQVAAPTTIALSANTPLVTHPVTVPSTPVPSATPNPSPTSLFPTVAPMAEWLVYRNDFYGYQFSYPPTANISVAGVDHYPTDEKPENISHNEFLDQLRETYPDNICVTIRYMYGFITIRAPQNNGGRYAVCGRSGVGDYTVVEKTEVVAVNGESITSEGMALFSSEDNTKAVRELFYLYLSDGTEIYYEYAVGLSESDPGSVKDVLTQIISSLHYMGEGEQDGRVTVLYTTELYVN